MPAPEAWPAPSAAVAELMREAARVFLEAPADLVAEIDRTIFEATPEGLREEPALAAAVAASTRANIVHWASWSLAEPGARVPVNLTPEVLDIARDAVRRGADQMILATYHAGQNVAWRYCMQMIFAMTSDPAELREALDVSARSIFAFVDDTIAAISARIEAERLQLTSGTHAERLEVVNLILEGAPIGRERASARLAYELERRHTAAVVWGEPGSSDQAGLVRAAEEIARVAGAHRPLTVVASASSIWAWFVAPRAVEATEAARAIEDIGGVRAALGPPGDGIAGFRRSHLDAIATQRLMYQAPELRVASFDDVRLVVLAAADEERAAEFVARTLGELASGDPELRQTLRVYIREQFSAARAARALYAHRNTVLNRLARAERLLPAPLEGRGLDVGLALELVHWLGARVAGEPG
jgi:DNA-binding PucR family transcriptional regulator